MSIEEAFTVYINLDSVTVICPCGRQITGEGEEIDRFKKLHAEHTNGESKEIITEDGKRAC